MNNEDKIKELEKRIVELEKRLNYVQYFPVVPTYIQQPPYRCPQCGSTGGCWHVVC